MSEYDVLVDMTCWVRCLLGWEDGRYALREYGIEPDEVICTYLGPGGGTLATCDFFLPDGRFLRVHLDRDPVTAKPCVLTDNDVETISVKELNEELARKIFASGEKEHFDAQVRDLYEQKYRPREPIITPKEAGV